MFFSWNKSLGVLFIMVCLYLGIRWESWFRPVTFYVCPKTLVVVLLFRLFPGFPRSALLYFFEMYVLVPETKYITTNFKLINNIIYSKPLLSNELKYSSYNNSNKLTSK